MMSSLSLIIGGARVAGAETFAVVNPATEEILAHAPECTPDQLDAAVDAALHAFKSWRVDFKRRRQCLLACAEIVRAHAQELALLLTREQGKPLAKATREVMGAAAWFEHTAKLDLAPELVPNDSGARIEVHRRPCGVVGAITPWNYPVILAVWKIAPALLAGNTIVLKPSPYTPLATLRLGEVLQSALPPGVLNVVSGGDELGKRVVAHTGIRKISFTGSTEAGKHVAAAAAADVKRVTLELGGNDAAIVLEDVDVNAVAPRIFWGAFENTGQVCAAIKRLFIHVNVYDKLVTSLTELARSMKVGDGLAADTLLGPLNNQQQFERISMLVDEARGAGGSVLAGGKRLGNRGYFYAPTIVAGLKDDARLVAEEQFGPALPCLLFSDVNEAVERANSTQFGLSGSVWSADVNRASSLAAQLECGTAWVNQHLSVQPMAPVSGSKWSGIGVENGRWGLESFTDIQTIQIPKA